MLSFHRQNPAEIVNPASFVNIKIILKKDKRKLKLNL